MMLHCRQKTRAVQQGGPVAAIVQPAKGPDDEKIKLILQRTGYTLDVTTGNNSSFMSVMI